MLKDCLRYIDKNKVFNARDFAKEMGIDEKFSQDIYQQLVSLGYIKEVGLGSCSPGACSSCNSICFHRNSKLKEIIISEKGKKALE